METFIGSIRVVVASMAICVGGYTALILGFAQAVTPETAAGSLVKRENGLVIGSRLVAQPFEGDIYFWARPSAVGYDAAGAGGSNKSPTSHALRERARDLIQRHRATAERPLPAELAAASGAGLDPHLTVRAAVYQAPRVARARGIAETEVRGLIERASFATGGGLAPDRLVNVLELNLMLDSLSGH
ncbi:MAG: potassium-transporting ATPase subunit C [Limisphaerales bacterium]